MRNIKVAFCDDDQVVGESVIRVGEILFEKCEFKVSSHAYNDPSKLLKDIQNGESFDLFFLDIEMPKIDGIGLALKIKEINPSSDIIFVSNREDKVFDTFKVQPFGFVRKKNFKEDFENVIKGYVATRIEGSQSIVIDTLNKANTVNIKISDIVYIECQKNHQFIHTIQKDCIEVKSTMETFEKKLEDSDIVRVHKGYMVNLKYVSCIDSKGVLMKDGFVAFISRDKVRDIKALYLKYLRKTGAVLFD